MEGHRIYAMWFAGGYPHYITKAETKGRTKAEVDEVAAAARRMLERFKSPAPPRDREVERQKARMRAARRFGPGRAHEVK